MGLTCWVIGGFWADRTGRKTGIINSCNRKCPRFGPPLEGNVDRLMTVLPFGPCVHYSIPRVDLGDYYVAPAAKYFVHDATSP